MKRQTKRLCSYFHAIKKAVPFFLIMTQVELEFADGMKIQLARKIWQEAVIHRKR